MHIVFRCEDRRHRLR